MRAAAQESNLIRVLPAALLVYAALLPFELRLTIADQTLYPPRIMAIIVLPWLCLRLPKARGQFVVWDWLLALSALWMIVAFMMNYGPLSGAVRGGILAFDIAVPYLAARIAINDSNDLRRLLVLIAPGLLLAGLSMVAEVIAARSLVKPFFASLFGPLPLYQGGDAVGIASSASFERRLGILRAAGPFSHPILAGVFLASFLPLYLYSSLRHWPIFGGIGASILAVFSASSAPILLLLINATLLAVDWLQRFVTFVSWKVILPTLGVFVLLLHLGSQNGLINVIIRLTLNPQTGYFRQLIWQYGTLSVDKHPFFGIGYEGFERPSWMPESVDNHWLLLAIRFGALPAFTIGFIAIAVVCILCLNSNRGSEIERRLRVSLAASLFSLCLMGFSVAFFGGMQTWFYMLIAIAVSIAIAPAERSLSAHDEPRAVPQKTSKKVSPNAR